MKKLILVAAIILSSACASNPVAVVAKLPIPPRPDMPAIASTDLMCISDDTYRTLVTRDKLWTNRVETLENIIESTH